MPFLHFHFSDDCHHSSARNSVRGLNTVTINMSLASQSKKNATTPHASDVHRCAGLVPLVRSTAGASPDRYRRDNDLAWLRGALATASDSVVSVKERARQY